MIISSSGSNSAKSQSLTSETEYPFVDEKGRQALAEWRADLGALLNRDGPLRHDGATVTWWTFASGRINQTLKYALEWKGGWKVVPDNFSRRIEGDGVSHGAIVDQSQVLARPEFWSAAETRDQLGSLVPEYRLSKFQRALPDRWSQSW